MGAVLPWLFLAAIFIVAFAISRGSLFLLVTTLPIDSRKASALAKNWSTIGAFLLGGWFIVSVAAGPSYPLVTAATVFVLGGILLLVARNTQYSEPYEQRNRMPRFLIVWLASCMASALIAFCTMRTFSEIIMAPAR
jgi:hypothetical protein